MHKSRFILAAALLLLGVASTAIAQNTPSTAVGITAPGTLAGDTSGLTQFLASSCGAGGGPDYWFRFCATGDGTVGATTCNSTGTLGDTVLAAYRGTPTLANEVACNDDTCGLKSTISFPVQYGEVYYIRVGDFAGGFGQGTFTVDVTGPVGAPDQYQRNSALLSYTINGQSSNGASRSVVNILSGGALNTSLSGTAGSVWEAVICPFPSLSRSAAPAGAAIGQCQIINLNFNAAAQWTYFNGGTSLGFLPMPASGISVNFNFGGPLGFAFAVQCVALNPQHQDGVILSSANDVEIAGCVSQNNPGPASDDGFLQVGFSTPFTFYGVSHTDMFINSNGNITFGSGDGDFTSTEAEMLADQARIAPCWEDFSPNIAGTVTYGEVGNVMNVTWSNVPHFGNASDQNTFCASLNLATGRISVSHGAMGLNAGTSIDQIVGISPGGGTSVANNVNLSATPVITLNPNLAVYEDFSQATFGAFDLSNSTRSWVPQGPGGSGPYWVQ